MGRKLLLPTNFNEYDFSGLIKEEKHQGVRKRLLAMLYLQRDPSITDAAASVGASWKTVQSWLSNFRAYGLEGLYDKYRSGRNRSLSESQLKELESYLVSASEDTSGGVMTAQAILNYARDELSCNCSLPTMYRALHDLNFSWISCRSVHPKTDPKAQEAYKKNSTK